MRVLALAMVLTACSSAPMNALDTYGRCTLVVRFASKCCGIDQQTRGRVADFLRSDPRVVSVTEHSWGREGEVDVCVQTRLGLDYPEFSTFYTALGDLLPENAEGTTGPVSLLLIGEDNE
ncbi:hypothetical protein [Brevundimonas sp.]|uniref:hypothetical protein n=1 Tax=Brevundimonas sp. TaxID=1871086 RepID=UPI001D4899A6|nr:hypothetical protein [Brevundimonas sp.]MBL0948466.1 hypothetical protein [Brevundimonas sp.]